MDELEMIVESFSLPLALPEEVFFVSGKPRRLPDIDLIINQLPAELQAHLDLEATVLHNGRGGQNTFILTLMDGSYLKIRIRSRSIVELAKTRLRGG